MTRAMEEWYLIGAVEGVTAVLILASVVVTVVTRRRTTRRVAALRKLARSQGWLFLPMDPFLPGRWHGHPFDKGRDRQTLNVVTGHVGPYEMVACDYEYKGVGQSHDTPDPITYAVCALVMPCALPELHVAPEAVLSRIGQTVGMYDIELESEEFNRRYRVRCADPKLATDVLTPRTMDALLRVPDFNARFVGTDVVWVTRGALQAADLPERLAALAALVDGIPAFVWNDYDPAAPPRAAG